MARAKTREAGGKEGLGCEAMGGIPDVLVGDGLAECARRRKSSAAPCQNVPVSATSRLAPPITARLTSTIHDRLAGDDWGHARRP